MSRFIRWAEHEIYSVLPALIFFGLAFNILHFSSVLMLEPNHVHYTSYFGATLGAIVAAKVIIIVRSLPFINLFPTKPLIYNISWKLLIYGFFVLLVQLLDLFFRSALQHKNISFAFQQLLQELTYPRFWGIQIWILFLFLIYIIFGELGRIFGPLDLRKLFFGY